MLSRIITAVVGIPLFLSILYIGGWPLRIMTTFLAVLAFWELSSFTRRLYWDFFLIFGLSFFILSYSDRGGAALFFWFLAQGMYFLIRSTFWDGQPLSLSYHLLAVFYVGLFALLWTVRVEMGFIWILFALLISWSTDTAAFFIGHRWGKHRLAPKLSPRKSVEGALGGLGLAILVGLVFSRVNGFPMLFTAALAALLSIVGQTGDLVESAMKRECGIKDSGTILPGHGGILDRFDSLLFILPSLYAVSYVFSGLF